jgi:hypothetical protein
MVYAIPRFENGRCILRFRSTGSAPVVLKTITIRREPFYGGAVPQILTEGIKLNPNQDVDYDVTQALIDHVAVNEPEQRTTILHFDLGYAPKDPDQPEGSYTVVSRGKNIVDFGLK